MGLGTLTESSDDEVAFQPNSFNPTRPARAATLVTAKESGHARTGHQPKVNMYHGHEYLTPDRMTPSAVTDNQTRYGNKPVSRISPQGTQEKLSYRETKEYLLSMGVQSREVLDAPTIFHLRNYALKKGIDLGPLEQKFTSALNAAENAKAAAIAAKAASKKAAADARRAEELAGAQQLELIAAARAAVTRVISGAALTTSAVAAATSDIGIGESAEEIRQPPSPAAVQQPAKRRPKRGDKEAHEMDVLLAAARAQVAHERSEAVAREEGKIAKMIRVQSSPQAVAQAQQAAAEAAELAAAAVAVQLAAEKQLAEIDAELRQERAMQMIQARARMFLQRQVYKWAWQSVVAMQKMYRSRAVRRMFDKVIAYTRLLKAGAVFLKFSQSGPPHDRFVWLDNDMRTIRWCHPNNAESRVVSEKTSFSLKDCKRVAEGPVTRTFTKSAVKRNWPGAKSSMGGQHQTLQLKLGASIKKDFDQIFHPSDSFSKVHNVNVPVDANSCFSLVFKTRTLDLVAADNRTRDDWLWALRMLRVHWDSDVTDLSNVHVQRKMMGVDEDWADHHRFSAVDVLGDAYVDLKVEVPRSANGMGLVMDAATNQILKVEVGSVAEEAGLYRGDLISVVDSNVVTVIQDGYFYPRSSVPAAINPSKDVITFTIFRQYFENDYDEEDEDLTYNTADPSAPVQKVGAVP